MNSSPGLLPEAVKIQAINALHDAEEAGQSLSARVEAVVKVVVETRPKIPTEDTQLLGEMVELLSARIHASGNLPTESERACIARATSAIEQGTRKDPG